MTIERKVYTLEEIARNDGNNGNPVWIIIHGTVYDVTDFLKNHPGGEELIIEYAGTDATDGFEDFGHSSDAKRTLKKLEIGIVGTSSSGDNIKNKNYVNDNSAINENKQNTRQRRKFLSTLLGRCAMKL